MSFGLRGGVRGLRFRFRGSFSLVFFFGGGRAGGGGGGGVGGWGGGGGRGGGVGKWACLWGLVGLGSCWGLSDFWAVFLLFCLGFCFFALGLRGIGLWGFGRRAFDFCPCTPKPLKEPYAKTLNFQRAHWNPQNPRP